MTRIRASRFALFLAFLAGAWGFAPRDAQALPTIDLMWDQAFTSSSDLTLTALEVAPILITNDSTTTFTSTTEMRLVIPSTYRMVWDTSDTVCEILLSGTGTITAAVSSWPATGAGYTTMQDHVALLDVLTDFNTNTRLVITGLTVKQWTEDVSLAAPTTNKVLALAWDSLNTTPDGTGDATSSQVWTNWRGSFASSGNWSFSTTDSNPLLPSFTITAPSTGGTGMNTTGHIHIVIPNGGLGTRPTFNTTIPSASHTISGSASAKVSSISYPSTTEMKITLSQNVANGESITVTGMQLTTPTAAYGCDSLELYLDNTLTTLITTDKRIFTIGPPVAAVATMTDVAATAADALLTANLVVTTSTSGEISSTQDLRLLVMPNSTPGGSGQGRDNLTWSSDMATTVTITGGGSGGFAGTPLLGTVDTGSQATQTTGDGRCAVFDVVTSFGNGSQITFATLRINNNTNVVTRLFVGLVLSSFTADTRTAAFGRCVALATSTNSSSASTSGAAGGTASSARGGGGACFLRAAERGASQ